MEEQKKTNKEVKMQPLKGGEQQKLSYDQLKEIADKLFNENRYLKQQLQQANDFARTINRLDYLFKVLENYVLFSNNFVDSCVEEIQKVMAIPKEEIEEKED